MLKYNHFWGKRRGFNWINKGISARKFNCIILKVRGEKKCFSMVENSINLANLYYES